MSIPARDVAEKTLEVIVEDVTRADDPATVLTRFRSRVEELPQTGHQLGPIDIDVELPDPKARYNVRARVMSGAKLSTGDLSSTRSYPIASGQQEVTLNIQVELIR
ncbi:MAG TPA: YbaY family lipoprotein [Anaerolineae bacterium]|nr:YbaY family lipoprotein [Anaerolineae bacterium]